MRVNKFIAQSTGRGRRAVDRLITEKRITVNGRLATLGQEVTANDTVSLDGKSLAAQKTVTIVLNKPIGYVVSRAGQGSQTIYALLPSDYQRLKPIGRLDKESSGLLLLTNDGQLAQQLTHPKFVKEKTYQVRLNRPLTTSDKAKLEQGVMLEDGLSRLQLSDEASAAVYRIIMHEGRNRQIRRTFKALGYHVSTLHRTTFGNYELGSVRPGHWTLVDHSD
jgi:23S rRNA pseudouridine2605 synthase